MKIYVILVILIFLPVASCEKINGQEVEWGSGATYTLSWSNPSITKEDYVIKVIDFDWKGNAAVFVTHQGETQKGILSQGESMIFNFTKNTTFQGVKIYSKKISHYSLPINIGTYPCCPAAEIEVWIAKVIEKKPKLELELNTYWDGRLGHTSKIYLTIRNTGDAAFSEGNVTISISGLRIADEQELSRQALTYNPSEEKVMRRWNVLLAGKSLNITLSVKAPLSSNRSSFTINAKAYFKDFKGNIYTATKSKTVELLNTLQIKKTITSSTILGEKTYGEIDKVFGLGRIVIVNIYVKNIQSYAVRSVVLDDMIMENFVLVNSSITPNPKLKNNKLQWVFDLNASETKEFRYELIPQKTGSFTAPAAIAHWNEFGITKTASSNTPATRVYGVFVVVSKKTDKHALKIDESFNVTVMLENIGDFPVGINVTDILPKNSTFVSGSTAFSDYLLPKEVVSFSYTLYIDIVGEVELPSPKVSFWKEQYDKAYGFIPAEKIIISMPVNENITITPAPTPQRIIKKTIWLEGIIPIIMVLITMILMLILHKRKP